MSTAKDERPKSYIVLTPAAVLVAVVLVIAFALAFKFLAESRRAAPEVVMPYPDQRDRVADLERELAAAKSAPPAYPDLSGKVATLESAHTALQQELAEAQAAPEYASLRNRLAASESELEATRGALDTARKGEAEARLRAERDELADRAGRLDRQVAQLRTDRERMQKLLTDTGRQMRRASAERTGGGEREAALASALEELQATRSALALARDEAARDDESLAAMQRTAQRLGAEAASSRAELDRLRAAQATLATENRQLRTAAVPVRPRVEPTPAPSASAPVYAALPRTHVVAGGDSLSGISERYYGTRTRWQEVYQANADLLGPTGLLKVGTVLRIP